MKIKIIYIDDEWLAQYTGCEATVLTETDTILHCVVHTASGDYLLDLVKGADVYETIV